MGLFRKIILVAGGLAVMPSPPDAPVDAQHPSDASYLAAAVGAASDAMEFCQRRATVCETAGYAAASFEMKAKYSVKLLYEWANREEPAGPEHADVMETGTTAASRGTLAAGDVVPAWKGRDPKKG